MLLRWALEGFFFQGVPIADFSRGSQKYFSRGRPKVVKFHFSLSKLRKQSFLLKIK